MKYIYIKFNKVNMYFLFYQIIIKNIMLDYASDAAGFIRHSMRRVKNSEKNDRDAADQPSVPSRKK
ncbi:MAG: hypothetical protein IE886_01525 [Campylobacterales bacterium]|nr:hypothetical protein [Campylobacterales bacterium]